MNKLANCLGVAVVTIPLAAVADPIPKPVEGMECLRREDLGERHDTGTYCSYAP